MRRIAATILLSAFLLHMVVMVAYVGYFYSFRSEIAAEFCINKEKKELDCRGCCHLSKTLNRITSGGEQPENSPAPVQQDRFEWSSIGIVGVQYEPVSVQYFYPQISHSELPECHSGTDTPPPRA